MAASRRQGLENSQTRSRLLDAAAEIVRREGCGAVTARRLGEQVGLKRHIVHYYFGTVEEVFLALVRRSADAVRTFIARSMEDANPLKSIWMSKGREVAMTLEYMALSTHLKSIREEQKRIAEEFREALTEATKRYIASHKLKLRVPPVAAVIVMQSVTQTLRIETALGTSYGHKEMKAVVEAQLRALTREHRSASRSVGRKVAK
jgi:AcrR family transcriptional regulator